jgi:tetratricopeptide (TPR) repeat protein
MRTGLCLFIYLLLAACATPAPVASAPAHLLRDELFAAPSQRISADDVFALSEPMKSYLRTEMPSLIRNRGAQEALIFALYEKEQLQLEYDAATTRTAAQAFDARRGNCLSLVIMTAALAKEMGLQVRYQSAYLEETWARSSDLLLRSGHINITLGRRLIDTVSNPYPNTLTVDFLPAETLRGLRVREIGENTVVAMFMNNRAAEALAAGRLDDAYAWVREAIRHDSGFASAYNTLGIVYTRRGQLPSAALAYEHVLEREPDNTRALSNLAGVLTRLGQNEAATALHQRLAQLEPHPPFYFFHQGQAAMKRSDFATARDLFAKEVARADYYHEFHFWLGLAHYHLGDLEQAGKHLGHARDSSASQDDRRLYAAKLNWLRAHSGR